MRIVLTFIAFVLISTSFSQEPSPVFMDTINDKTWISLNGFDYYGSTRFNNDYMDKWLFGGEITSEIKNKPQSKLGSVNAIGGEFENGFSVWLPSIDLFKVERLGLMFNFSDMHYFSANIPTDLYNVAMFGNSSYIGDTLNFNFANAQYQHYQKIGIGLFDQKTLSSVKLSYIAGSKTANFRLGNSWMYTYPDVDTIGLQLQGAGFMSESFSPYFALNGHGFSVDLDYNFIFESKKGNRQVINFRVSNLGAIFWNKDTYLYGIDSTNYYSGFEVNDFLNQDTTSDAEFNIADTLGLAESQGLEADFLPIELSVQKLGDQGSSQKLQLIAGFKAILSSNYFPYFFAGGYFKATDNISISSRLSYGGFGGLNWGLNANFWLKDKIYIGLGSFNVIGLISKKAGYGRGLNFNCNIKL